ncbi:MAG: helix-turn-helix domain-containing protein [Halovenus sp.]
MTTTSVGTLSRRQPQAMDATLARGYDDVPGGASVEGVGDELDCSRATAAEHLRKAESKIISSLVGRSPE